MLVVHARRFQLVNWVPQKVGKSLRCFLGIQFSRWLADVPIKIDHDSLLLDPLFSKGKSDSEIELPEDESTQATLPEFNAAAMAQLEGMGFPLIRCQKALLATGNNDAEAAMNWLFEHMEDAGESICWKISCLPSICLADIDDPIQLQSTATTSSASADTSPEQISMIVDMGFTAAQAKKGLKQTVSSLSKC